MAGLKEALVEAVDNIAPVIEEGTILRINVTIDVDGADKEYTYCALFVGSKWYLSGFERLLGREYASTSDLLLALSRQKKFTIELATAYDTVR